MVKMVQASEQTGLPKGELVVELDFTAGENGTVPAMQDVPEFKIAPAKDYFEGSRPAEPDWFQDYDQELYEIYLANMKEKYGKLQTDRLLCLVRYETGIHIYSVRRYVNCVGVCLGIVAVASNTCITTCCHCRKDPETMNQLFTQQAVLGFKAYMEDGDDGPLSEFLGPKYLEWMKQELGFYYGIGMTASG